jgi:ribonuclease HI
VPTFACLDCGRPFAVSDATLEKYPGWTPKRCLACKNQSPTKTSKSKIPVVRSARSASSAREENLTVAEVLAKYTDGPDAGVFTDGAADPNPGPGGWGAVYIVGNRIEGEKWGQSPHTTNNRMELSALIAGCALVPKGTGAILYSDSQLCVNTMNMWAKGWKARGWKRKDGEIKNLELVKELYGILEQRPELELRWIAAHSGLRWNEYADSLATAYRRTKR